MRGGRCGYSDEEDRKRHERPIPGYKGLVVGIIERASDDRFIRALDEFRDKRRCANHRRALIETHRDADAFFVDGRCAYWMDLAGIEKDGILCRYRREREQEQTTQKQG